MDKKNIASENVQLQITQDTIQRIQSINQQNNWEFEQGIRRILGAGLGYLEMHSFIEEDPSPDEKAALIRRVIEGESIIASLQYKLFEIESVNKNWKLSSGAIQTENIGLRKAAFNHLKNIDSLTLGMAQLKKENDELKKQIEALTSALGGTNETRTSNLLGRILRGRKRK